MVKKTKSIPISNGITVSDLIKILSGERQDSKMALTNQYGDFTTRTLRIAWEEPPLFKVDPCPVTPEAWCVLNTKTSEVLAPGIKLKQIAEYICADLNKRLDK